MFSGRALIRFYGRLTVIGGFAAIVGPLLGGLLTAFTDWRGLFVFLAVIGVAILVVTLRVFGETLPADRRTTGGFGQTLRDYRTLLTDRVFLGTVLNQGFLYAALFAYLAGSTFVLQDIYGLSPQWYAAAFGLNSAGHMVFGYLAGRSAERWSIPGTLAIGVVVTGLGAIGLLVAGRHADAAVGRARGALRLVQRRRDHRASGDDPRDARLSADGGHRLVAAGDGPVRLRRNRRPVRRCRRCAEHPAPRRDHDHLGAAGRGILLAPHPRRGTDAATAVAAKTLAHTR